jgi:hypothetical protein
MAVCFITVALDGGEWSASCPGHFIPRERRPRKIDGPRSQSGCCEGKRNFLPFSDIEPQSLVGQPVA